jgi:thiamine pyrophosphokinase
MGTNRFVVFTGHWSENAELITLPDPASGDFVSCADVGYLSCKSARVKPDIVIGDFDSLTDEQINEIDDLDIKRIVHPCGKNETDTLLCVKYGLSLGFDSFLIIGGIGGDFSHTLANLQVLSFLTDMQCKAEIITKTERLRMIDGETISAVREPKPALHLIIHGEKGEKFSVFSYAERSSGVYIENARYELKDAILTQSYPVGVSNEFTEKDTVTISVKYGRLLVVCNV